MPPSGFFSRNLAIGEPAPSGSSNSILVFGSSTKTTVTPWSGCAIGCGDLGAQHVAIGRGSGGEVLHRDGDMVQTADHARSLFGSTAARSHQLVRHSLLRIHEFARTAKLRSPARGHAASCPRRRHRRAHGALDRRADGVGVALPCARQAVERLEQSAVHDLVHGRLSRVLLRQAGHGDVGHARRVRPWPSRRRRSR